MQEIKRGDIYYADLGTPKGSVQAGIRPVIVIQNDVGNTYSPTVIVAAITSKMNKSAIPTHVYVDVGKEKRKSMILLEHIQTINKADLMNYVGRVDTKTICSVDCAIKVSLGL